jgi:hypothetical protein
MHQLLAIIGAQTSLHSFAGVPTTISLEDVRAAILDVPGVLSVHELHVWQLSEAKVVASVHIAASRQVDFMVVAGQVREKLHHLGIHSCTIQPEYHQSQNSPLDEALMVRAQLKVGTCSVSHVVTDDSVPMPHSLPSRPGMLRGEQLLPYVYAPA